MQFRLTHTGGDAAVDAALREMTAVNYCWPLTLLMLALHDPQPSRQALLDELTTLAGQYRDTPFPDGLTGEHAAHLAPAAKQWRELVARMGAIAVLDNRMPGALILTALGQLEKSSQKLDEDTVLVTLSEIVNGCFTEGWPAYRQ